MSNSARAFLRKEDVNPAVWEAIQSFRSTIAYAYGTGSEERIEQYTEWQKVYWSVRGKGWTWGLSIWLSLILAVPFAIQLGKPYLGIAILSWFAIGGLGSLIAYLVGLQTVAIQEMRFIVGRAKLDPVQKLYGEALCDPV